MPATYAGVRPPIYILLFLVSASVLGLTAFRIHTTREDNFVESPIVVLLVAACLTILWVPFALHILSRYTFIGATRTTARTWHPGFMQELFGTLLLWALWLIGAAWTTNFWPGTRYCPVGLQCSILIASMALAWVAWSLLSIVSVLILMQYVARNSVVATGNSTTTTTTSRRRHNGRY